MKTIPFTLAALLLVGCLAPREPAPPLPSRACPPLPLLPDAPTTAQRRAWTETVIAQYVACAQSKGHPR